MARKLRVLILQPAQQKAQRIVQEELAKAGWGAPDLAIGKTTKGKPRMRTARISSFDPDPVKMIGFDPDPIRSRTTRRDNREIIPAYANSNKTLGCRVAIFSNTFAGPAGVRRPCSQFCNVSALIPSKAANFDCDKPSFPRTRTMLDSGFT